MKLKRILKISALATVVIISSLLVSGCSKTYHDVKITGCDVVSITPDGMRAVNILLNVTIDNPIIGFELSNNAGKIMMDGEEFMTITAERVVVDGNCEKTYMVPVRGELAQGFNPLKLFAYVQTRDFSNLTADVTTKISFRGGLGKTIEKKGVRIGDMLNEKLK